MLRWWRLTGVTRGAILRWHKLYSAPKRGCTGPSCDGCGRSELCGRESHKNGGAYGAIPGRRERRSLLEEGCVSGGARLRRKDAGQREPLWRRPYDRGSERFRDSTRSKMISVVFEFGGQFGNF